MTDQKNEEPTFNRRDSTRYAVSIEVCHILTEYDAERLAELIRDRLNDIPEDVYICVSKYEQVRCRKPETFLVR